jgi:hypothetical protein
MSILRTKKRPPNFTPEYQAHYCWVKKEPFCRRVTPNQSICSKTVSAMLRQFKNGARITVPKGLSFKEKSPFPPDEY